MLVLPIMVGSYTPNLSLVPGGALIPWDGSRGTFPRLN